MNANGAACARDSTALDLDRFLREECGLTLAEWCERGERPRFNVAYANEDGRQASLQEMERRIQRADLKRQRLARRW